MSRDSLRQLVKNMQANYLDRDNERSAPFALYRMPITYLISSSGALAVMFREPPIGPPRLLAIFSISCAERDCQPAA
jgi:hypothetical protein